MLWQSLTIACNEAEWIEPQIRSLYDFFDRLVVVDGAAKGDGSGKGDGKLLTGGLTHSTDGTVEILKRLERDLSKLKVVYAPAAGWRGKTEMCQAGLLHMEHGWIFQRDVDEFWFEEDLQRLKAAVEDSDYTDADFYALHFWGDRHHHMKLSRTVWGNEIEWRRLFRYSGERWESHEPPRLQRKHENLLSMEETRALGILLYHYSYCDLGQLRKKERFYDCSLVPTIEEWRRDPESVPKNADLQEFRGKHPVQLPEIQ